MNLEIAMYRLNYLMVKVSNISKQTIGAVTLRCEGLRQQMPELKSDATEFHHESTLIPPSVMSVHVRSYTAMFL
jgi:hypothetical protein